MRSPWLWPEPRVRPRLPAGCSITGQEKRRVFITSDRFVVLTDWSPGSLALVRYIGELKESGAWNFVES